MHFINRLFGSRRAQETDADLAPVHNPFDATYLAMASALTFGLEARNARLLFVEHCTRVAGLADHVAARLGVPPDAREVLGAAARLHEIGMVSVPADVLEAPGRLAPEDRELIRGHAAVGAQIVRATHDERTARLIEHQYSDFARLQQMLPDDVDLLLAGILRAADVFDAVTHPRPYQEPLRSTHRQRILVQGSGSRFHPRAVEVLLHMDA